MKHKEGLQHKEVCLEFSEDEADESGFGYYWQMNDLNGDTSDLYASATDARKALAAEQVIFS